MKPKIRKMVLKILATLLILGGTIVGRDYVFPVVFFFIPHQVAIMQAHGTCLSNSWGDFTLLESYPVPGDPAALSMEYIYYNSEKKPTQFLLLEGSMRHPIQGIYLLNQDGVVEVWAWMTVVGPCP